jgi:succinate dehydrogenase / fumarate reductase cytochrome b subunit
MAEIRTDRRPLSPHLQIWRWTLPMALSILHRMTGAALYIGTLLLVWWLMAAATGPAYFDFVQGFFSSWFGRLLLFGFSWALIHHMLGGIRHLMWDTGYGLDLPTVYRTGWVVTIGSVGLTLLLWIIGYVVA